MIEIKRYNINGLMIYSETYYISPVGKKYFNDSLEKNIDYISFVESDPNILSFVWDIFCYDRNDTPFIVRDVKENCGHTLKT